MDGEGGKFLDWSAADGVDCCLASGIILSTSFPISSSSRPRRWAIRLSGWGCGRDSSRNSWLRHTLPLAWHGRQVVSLAGPYWHRIFLRRPTSLLAVQVGWHGRGVRATTHIPSSYASPSVPSSASTPPPSSAVIRALLVSSPYTVSIATAPGTPVPAPKLLRWVKLGILCGSPT